MVTVMQARRDQSRIGGMVRIGETLDALYVAPRDRSEASELLRRLQGLAGDDSSAVRRTSDGIRVLPEAARHLGERADGLNLSWEPEALRFVENRARASLQFEGALKAVARIKSEGAGYARTLIADSAGIGTLDDHQIVNVAAMTIPGSPGLCVFDEQGAGKTVTFIFAYDLLVARDEADLAIIVAPKSMVGEWPKDIQRFRGDLYRPALLTGPRKAKRQALASGADVFITNFETAVSMEDELRALMRARPGRTVLAIDESFFIKSLDAKRTRALRRLREWAGRAYVLCGTPAPNAPNDLVQQFSLVDFGLAFSGVEIPKDREEAGPVVQAVVESRGLLVRHLKSDVLPDLPAKTFQRVFVPMAGEQRRLYERTLGDLITDVQAADEEGFARQITSFLARRAALLQICSNPAAVSPGYSETPAKLALLDELVTELVERAGEKVVIWSFYTGSVTAIVERYARYGAVRYDGQVTDVAVRQEAVSRFQSDEATRVFVANPAAAGAGLTLHRARFAIYESLSNQAAHYLQSLDRIHRRGQSRPVEYVVMLCEDSIEIAEYERLVQKEQAAQELLGDVVQPPLTRESFLSDIWEAAALLRANA